MKILYRLRLCLLAILPIIAFAQNNTIDSLKSKLGISSDTSKAKILSDLCWEYRNISLDSAVNYGNRAIDFSRKRKLKQHLAQSLNDLGIIYTDKSEFEKALSLFYESLDIRKNAKDSMGMASLFLKIGIVYQKQGAFQKALEYQIKALALYEPLKFKKGISYCLNNIANVNYNMGNNSKALEYHQKSYAMKKEMNDEYGMAGSLVNIGNIYFEQKNYNLAISTLRDALSSLRKIGDREYLSACLNNLGSALVSNGNSKEAYPHIVEALKLRKQEDDKKGLMSSYINYANACFNLNMLNETKMAFEEALKLSKQISALPEQVMLYKSLSDISEKTGNSVLALNYLRKHNELQDSLLNVNLNTQIAEMQTKYETEKKEKENALLKNENAIKKLQLAKEKSQRNLLLILILLILISSAFILVALRNKNRIKISRALLQQERVKLNEILQTQEYERKRISRELHDGVGQMMAVVRMNVSAIEPDQQYVELYNKSLKLIDQSCEEIRQISHQLMPGVLIKGGLKAGLDELAMYVNGSGNTKVYVDLVGFEQRPSETIEINLYRIIQELLTNILKHAEATEVHIQLTKENEFITMMLEDNGKGLDIADLKNSKGNGWHNINSRLNLLKGNIEIDSKPGKGTAIFIEINENNKL
ncbi:MAG TPA: sensor histidine kinase [Bacteroidia bacterium]|nr:sensor histidine kinase [Bacteroidia bacterium]